MEGLTVCGLWPLRHVPSVVSTLSGRDAWLLSGKPGLSSLPRVGEEEVLEKLLKHSVKVTRPRDKKFGCHDP